MTTDKLLICGRCGTANEKHRTNCLQCDAKLPFVATKIGVATRNGVAKRPKLFSMVFVILALVIGSLYYLHSTKILIVTDNGVEFKLRQMLIDVTKLVRPIGTKIGQIEKPGLTPSTVVGSKNAQPAISATIFPLSKNWSNEDGWRVYQSSKMYGCFAESIQADGTIFVLGLTGLKYHLVIGASNTAIPDRVGVDVLTYVFDERRTIVPYVRYLKFNSQTIIAGSYGDLGWLQSLVASSNKLSLLDNGAILAEILLKDTRKTLVKLSECNKKLHSDPPDLLMKTRAWPLSEVLCGDRPKHGRILTRNGKIAKDGHSVTVKNGTNSEALVLLRRNDNDNLVVSFLVGKGKSMSINGVRDGTYKLQYALGHEFDQTCKNFLEPATSQFDRKLEFKTSQKKSGTKTTTTTVRWTFTLNPVAGGNATTSKIGAAEFNRE